MTAKLSGWSRYLSRGESLVASTGLTLAAILLVAMASSTWWMMRSHRQSVQAEQHTQLESFADAIGAISEALLEANELAALRRIIAQTAHSHQLAHCRISLANGLVIADLDSSKIQHGPLPAIWPKALADAGVSDDLDSSLRRQVLAVPGRGDAILEMSAPVRTIISAPFEAQVGVGAIGAGCLIALLLVYRRMRRRFRGIGAVRDALMALDAGEGDPGALVVSEIFGEEALAWNRAVSKLQQMFGPDALDVSSAHSTARCSEMNSDLEGMCDAMWQGLILVDEHLKIRYANGAAALLLQIPREKIMGSVLTTVIADENVLKPVQAVVGGKLRQRTSVQLERSAESGNTVLRFNVRPARRGDSAAAMIHIEDITQQRVAEQARNTFVAQATHELRMPLTNIRLYVENAIDEGEKDPALRAKCLNVINQESRRLERIVGDMMSVTEIEAGTMKLHQGDVRLDALLNELRIDYQAQADEKRIELKFALPPKLPVIKGDRDKLALTLHNLVGNALKYTPEGGKVTVTVDVVDKQLVVDVSDTGLGINDDEQELIFEKFYRSKDSRIADIPGSGLGLALARDVVRLHGGDITLKSQLNEGSTFTIAIPILNEAA